MEDPWMRETPFRTDVSRCMLENLFEETKVGRRLSTAGLVRALGDLWNPKYVGRCGQLDAILEVLLCSLRSEVNMFLRRRLT